MAIEFMPRMTNGRTGAVHPRPSTSHAKPASSTKSSPAMNTANELVQSFLLIGSH